MVLHYLLYGLNNSTLHSNLSQNLICCFGFSNDMNEYLGILAILGGCEHDKDSPLSGIAQAWMSCIKLFDWNV